MYNLSCKCTIMHFYKEERMNVTVHMVRSDCKLRRFCHSPTNLFVSRFVAGSLYILFLNLSVQILFGPWEIATVAWVGSSAYS